jgi:catechol 2,3-dioxygenase-like lactoylglutathione lyase family enzyme
VEPKLHFITVATDDLDAARAFYVDGLGWTALLDVPGEILFFQLAPGLTLGLFDAVKFRADVKDAVTETSTTGLTLSHNVDSPEEVDRVVADAVTAGARLVKSPQKADFGGYHGHFADPNGVLWEVCHNPGWHVAADGTVVLGPVD